MKTNFKKLQSDNLLKKFGKLLETAAKGWSKVAPKTKSERESVYDRGGAECFLDPNPKDKGESRYPVCRKTDAQFDCRGALAAFIRARQHNENDIAKRAFNKAKRKKCDWTKNKSLKDYGL